jgi:hypothetical protein
MSFCFILVASEYLDIKSYNLKKNYIWKKTLGRMISLSLKLKNVVKLFRLCLT